jgi:hypothetical protein
MMKKSTVSISLTLIGSAVFLAGCRSKTDEENEARRTGGMFVGPRMIGGSGARGGSSVSTGASARGGFGGSAASAVGS